MPCTYDHEYKTYSAKKYTVLAMIRRQKYASLEDLRVRFGDIMTEEEIRWILGELEVSKYIRRVVFRNLRGDKFTAWRYEKGPDPLGVKI